MASLTHDSDSDDEAHLTPMTLSQRPKGYRKTKKIHSLRKGRSKKDDAMLAKGNQYGHIQAAIVPGHKDAHKLTKKLDKFIHEEEMESHLDSAFNVTKAKRYVALRDAQQREEREAWHTTKASIQKTRAMCTWGEFIIFQEELNDREKMRNVAQMIVNCDTLENEDSIITAKDGYDHYFLVKSGNYDLWLGRSSLMGAMTGGVLDKNGDTMSKYPVHRICCQRHPCSLYPRDESDKLKLLEDQKLKSEQMKSKKPLLASFVDESSLDQIRKPTSSSTALGGLVDGQDQGSDGDTFTYENDVTTGVLLTPVTSSEEDVLSFKQLMLEQQRNHANSIGPGAEAVHSAKMKHDKEMERRRKEVESKEKKRRELEYGDASLRSKESLPRYLRWKAGREKKSKMCSCHFSGCIMIRWTQAERETLKQRCGQKGLPKGFNDLMYRQNRYLTDDISLVLYQLCELMRELETAENQARKILGDIMCIDTLEEIDLVRRGLDHAVSGPPPFKTHFDRARTHLKDILARALQKRLGGMVKKQ